MEQNEIIQVLSQSALVGAALSLLMQFIKNKFGLDSNKSKLIILVVCLVGASAFYLLKSTPYWMPLLGILGTASALYNFIIKSTGLKNMGSSTTQEEPLG
jgi:hypothetical protein